MSTYDPDRDLKLERSALQKAIANLRPEPVEPEFRSAGAIMIDLLEVMTWNEAAQDEEAGRIAALKAEARAFIASGRYD